MPNKISASPAARISRTSGDRIVTQVYPLQNESAVQLVPILRPLITPNNTISAYAGTNTLVITDYADNIRRLNKIIEAIDQAELRRGRGHQAAICFRAGPGANAEPPAGRRGRDDAWHPADGSNSDSGQKFLVLPDVRSNSLLIRSDNPARITRARSLVDTTGRGRQPDRATSTWSICAMRKR